MKSAIIFGGVPAVDNSAFMSTEMIYSRVGGNTGNLAFNYAMHNIIGNHRPVISWHEDPDRINQLQSIGVMPCANQLGMHTDLTNLGKRLSKLTIPLVAVGLGAQAGVNYGMPEIPAGSQSWVREIAEHASGDGPNIGVRGEFTLRVLEQYGLSNRAIVTGCPSLFLNPDPTLGRQIEAKSKQPLEVVAVAAGHQKWTGLSTLEASLIDIMEATGGILHCSKSFRDGCAWSRGLCLPVG